MMDTVIPPCAIEPTPPGDESPESGWDGAASAAADALEVEYEMVRVELQPSPGQQFLAALVAESNRIDRAFAEDARIQREKWGTT